MDHCFQATPWRALPVLLLSFVLAPCASAQTTNSAFLAGSAVDKVPHKSAANVESTSKVDRTSQNGKAPAASPVFVTQATVTIHAADENRIEQTFYLPAGTSSSDANEMTVAIRNVVTPTTKVYLVESQGAVVMNTTPDQLELTKQILAQLNSTWLASKSHGASTPYLQSKTGVYTDRLEEQTFYLPGNTERNYANEIQVALRNMLDPTAKIYLVMSKNAIVIATTADQLQLAGKIIKDLLPGS